MISVIFISHLSASSVEFACNCDLNVLDSQVECHDREKIDKEKADLVVISLMDHESGKLGKLS